MYMYRADMYFLQQSTGRRPVPDRTNTHEVRDKRLHPNSRNNWACGSNRACGHVCPRIKCKGKCRHCTMFHFATFILTFYSCSYQLEAALVYIVSPPPPTPDPSNMSSIVLSAKHLLVKFPTCLAYVVLLLQMSKYNWSSKIGCMHCELSHETLIIAFTISTCKIFMERTEKWSNKNR